MIFTKHLALAAALGSVGSACAQTHVVKKPETVVRAVGVYEWTGSETRPTASRFVPVTLFIDGHLEDAAVYLARPVPFALQTGTVFELQNAGVPEGTLELSFARRLVESGDVPLDDGWLGFGSYKPLGRPKAEVSHLRSGPVSQVQVSGGKGRPSFSNQPGSGKPAASPSTSTTTDNSVDPDRPTLNRKTGNPSDSAPAASTPVPANSAPDPAADRPTAKSRNDSDSATPQTPQSQPAPAETPAASQTDADRSPAKRPDAKPAATDEDRAPDADPERPTLRRRTDAQRQAARKEHDSSSVVPGTASLNDDPDRPNLHRGKPAGALDDDDLPALKGLPANVERAVGVSDAANRPEHDFRRAWEDEAEHAAVLSRMQGLARVALLGSSPSAASSAAAKPDARTDAAARRRTAPKTRSANPAPALPLTDEKLNGYTLSYGGAATYVYSATSAGADGASRYVSIVAQREPTGELKVAMSNVTDSTHLDRAPRFELVDAVDAEASNRASLLFELRAQSSRQFALYRVIGGEAQQTFVTGSMD